MGDMQYVIADIAIGTYTSGGEVFTAAEFGLVKIVDLSAAPAGTTGYMDMAIRSTLAVKIMTATGTEASGNVGTHCLMIFGY